MTPEVFCIGFHKTGTSSMNLALRQLGYRVHGPLNSGDRVTLDDLRARAMCLARRYDAFEDNPWPIFFRELLAEFPGGKFILTVREPNDWIASVVKHFGERSTPMRELVYGLGRGSPVGNEDVYVQRYEAHNRAVVDYFGNAPQDLLIMDVSAADAWEVLCGFLGHPVPATAFPHANASTERQKKRTSLVHSIMRKLTGRR